MQKKNQELMKSTLINLYLFYILYFALVLAERQILRKGYLNFQLPFRLDALETIAVMVFGSILVTVLSILFKNRTWVLSLVTISILVLGSIYLNYFLFRFYYPPFITTAPGDLNTLGEERWQHDYPYQVLSAVYDTYYQRTIYINPEIDNFDELSRVLRFGVDLTVSSIYPSSLSEAQYTTINGHNGINSQKFISNGTTYLLYEVQPEKDLVLVRYDDKIIFLPEELVRE